MQTKPPKGTRRIVHAVRKRLQPLWRGEVSGDLRAPYLLNVGCGSRLHPAWVNLDLTPLLPGVHRFDVRAPLPLGDGTCAVAYSSHLLEHLDRDAGRSLVAELFRVLVPGGILRLAVPDLEAVARLYLAYLERALDGDEATVARHEWMTIELIDQLTRSEPGGEILRYWSRDPIPEEAFVYERMGEDAREAVAALRASPPSRLERSRAWRAFEKFRHERRGERHRWMYDRVSLSRLLTGIGFIDVRRVEPSESRIPGFETFLLDIDAAARVRKPDSLFIEATKPV